MGTLGEPDLRCATGETPSSELVPDSASESELSAPVGGRILIVEDEYLIGISAEDALIAAGFTVLAVATNAAEAIRLAVAETPDLVLMDIRLGEGPDGIAAAAEIIERTGIRCVFATARTDDTTRHRAASSKPLGWLAKPYDA